MESIRLTHVNGRPISEVSEAELSAFLDSIVGQTVTIIDHYEATSAA